MENLEGWSYVSDGSKAPGDCLQAWVDALDKVNARLGRVEGAKQTNDADNNIKH